MKCIELPHFFHCALWVASLYLKKMQHCKFLKSKKKLLPLKYHFLQYNTTSSSLFSAFLRNFFLCWDCWNGDMMPTLDRALLCSSRASSDLGHESGLVYKHRTCLQRVQSPQVGFDPPAQSEICYQTTALPSSHHGWIENVLRTCKIIGWAIGVNGYTLKYFVTFVW